MRVGVLGIGKTPHKIQHEKSLRDLVVESGRAAMADAGVEPSDIQALYVGNVGSVGFNYENSTGLMSAHHLGVVPAGCGACGGRLRHRRLGTAPGLRRRSCRVSTTP